MSNRRWEDPYSLRPESIEAPPNTLAGVLRRVGPGLIVAASVVGSGELIATTVLGAENGYSLLWLVVLSCAIKAVVQNELGRYAIATGETGLEALNRVPGPRFRVGWVVWAWFLMTMAALVAHGGAYAAISEVLNQIVPGISVGTCRHLPKSIAPRVLITLILWIVSFIMLILMGYSVLRSLT